MPEYEQGMNVARIGVLLAGLPNTRRRHDDQPLLLVGPQRGVDRRRPHPHRRGRHHDRRRHREHEHDPDARPARAQRGGVRARRERRHRLRHGPDGREGRRAVEGVARGAGCVRAGLASEGARRAGGRASSTPKSARSRSAKTRPTSRPTGSSRKSKVVQRDEGPRADTSAEGLAKLRPGLRGEGFGHRRQQLADVRRCRRVDPRVGARAARTEPGRRSRDGSAMRSAACAPEIMGVGPIAAIPKVLGRPASARDQLDWIELNEAFAAQAIAVMRELGLDPAKVNPLGGAIALGHPLGATGAIRTATIMHGMRRNASRSTGWSRCAWAPAWAPRASSKRSKGHSRRQEEACATQ